MENNIYKKIFEISRKIGFTVKADKTNSYYNNEYASEHHISQTVRPLLAEAGIMIRPVVNVTVVEGKPWITLELVAIDFEDGSETTLQQTAFWGNPDPQKQQSTITYNKRQLMLNGLGLSVSTDDDDANAAIISQQKNSRRVDANPQLQVEPNATYKDLNSAIRQHVQNNPNFDADAFKKYVKDLYKIEITGAQHFYDNYPDRVDELIKTLSEEPF